MRTVTMLRQGEYDSQYFESKQAKALEQTFPTKNTMVPPWFTTVGTMVIHKQQRLLTMVEKLTMVNHGIS